MRYGHLNPYLAVFLASVDSSVSLLYFIVAQSKRHGLGTSLQTYPITHRVLPFVRSDYLPVSLLHFSESRWCRNIYLLSIIYAFRPQLRSRLTLGGRTFPRKPQTFDGEVSRLPLATYAGILSCISSIKSSDSTSAFIHCSSTDTITRIPKLRCQVLAPVIFRASSLDQ